MSAAAAPLVACPYCEREAEPCTGVEVYPHRPDLGTKRFWRCVPCDAYVGCHEHTNRPLGRLANAELRALKIAVHAAFDPLWHGNARRGRGKNRKHLRSATYERLAQGMGIPRAQCHIAMFSETQCAQALEVICGWTVPQEVRA